ncbi:MFS transporter [Nocardia sp. NPDC050712]|uniref:MFS transporter n=1 Tax=Nocardia sp. NPDC050712 TaxID=3155518 RepID=UPI0033FBACFC
MTEQRNPLPHFLTARALSVLGDRVTDVVLPLAVLAASGSAVTAGAVGAAAQLPLVLLALVTGTGDAVFHAAAGRYLPSLVGDRDLMRANGLVEGSDAAATMTGPAAGGWLLGSMGPLVAFAVNAVSFVASAVLLARLPTNVPALEESDEDESVLAGLRLVRRERAQAVLLAGACYLHLLAAATLLPLLVRADEELGLTPLTTGLIVSAAGLGGPVSSFVLARFGDILRWPLLLAVVLSVNGGAAGMLALFDAALWLAATVLVLDGASALGFIVVATTRQRVTPDALRGRVFAASTAATATVRMLGLAGAGGLIGAVGPRPVLLALAALALPFALLLVLAGSARG